MRLATQCLRLVRLVSKAQEKRQPLIVLFGDAGSKRRTTILTSAYAVAKAESKRFIL